jgi:hypothetical protein
LKQEFSLKPHLQELAKRLRQLEFERARGNLPALEQIEQETDAAILQKWGWIGTIVFSLIAFAAMPLAIGILQGMLPRVAGNILWAITKILMGTSLLMFAASIYFTIGLDLDR